MARFTELLPETENFLNLSKRTEHIHLENSHWLFDLTFLTDIIDMLNDLNLELRGKDKHVINVISSVNTFKIRLQLLSNKLQYGDLRSFPDMQAELQRHGKNFAQLDGARYEEQFQGILSECERSFTDIVSIENCNSLILP